MLRRVFKGLLRRLDWVRKTWVEVGCMKMGTYMLYLTT
jgi:hypothetical protein